jgi:hypothetical protein
MLYFPFFMKALNKIEFGIFNYLFSLFLRDLSNSDKQAPQVLHTSKAGKSPYDLYYICAMLNPIKIIKVYER